MRKRVRKAIEDITNLIIECYDIGIPINDIDSIIKDMGGQIIYSEHGSTRIYKKEVNNSFIIEVPKNMEREYQVYKIAVMLGHLFLHMGYIIDNDTWNKQQDRISFNTSVECGIHEVYQAEAFAVDLLMPRIEFTDKLYDMAEKNKEYKISIKELGKYFNVPEHIVYRRAHNLGIIN